MSVGLHLYGTSGAPSASVAGESVQKQTAEGDAKQKAANNASTAAPLATAQQATHASTVSAKNLEAQLVREIIGANPFVIDTNKVEQLKKVLGNDIEKLLRSLVPFGKSFARPPISQYQVSVAGLGKSGKIYFGVNLEFKGFPLNSAVHGEQFLIANARRHGETELVAIAISAAPCGHCRQFMNEIEGGSGIKILFQKPGANGTSEVSTNLATLLPESFGPQDLGLAGGLLTPVKFAKSNHANPLAASAIDAANSSYAPYSKSLSGVALRTTDGKVYTGSYLENAAFNPSLSPLQSALISLIADMCDYSKISEVVLAEPASANASQAAITEGIIKSIAPQAKFQIVAL